MKYAGKEKRENEMPVTEYKVLRGVLLRASEAWPLLHGYSLSKDFEERSAQLKHWIQKELPILNKYHEITRQDLITTKKNDKCPHHIDEEKLDVKLFSSFPAYILSFYTIPHDQNNDSGTVNENDKLIAVGYLIKRLIVSQTSSITSGYDNSSDEVYEHLAESLKPELYRLIDYTQLLFIQNDCSCVQ